MADQHFDEAVADLTGEPPAAAGDQAAYRKGKKKNRRVEPIKEQSVAQMLRKAPKVRIILEESEEIPPSGQFVAINGFGYQIVPGEEVDVPKPLLGVLDDALVDRPVRDHQLRVAGYRKARRLPYRVIQDPVKEPKKKA